MAKKTNHKEAKPTKETPKAKKEVINWDEVPSLVYVIGVKGKHITVGQEYQVSKEIAEILVNAGNVKLK